MGTGMADVIFILLVIAYQVLVQGPLSRTLRERRARTTGAIEDANKAIAAAERRAAEYADKLRHARAEVFRLREQRLQQWARERESAIEGLDREHRKWDLIHRMRVGMLLLSMIAFLIARHH